MLYGEEVRARVKVLIEKALVAYERSLAIGKHAPSAGDWVATSRGVHRPSAHQVFAAGEPNVISSKVA